MLGKSVSIAEYGRAYKQLVQQVWSLGICLSDNDVLVRFILLVPEELSEELQSRISACHGRNQFLTLDHLIAWSQEIQDDFFVPRPTKLLDLPLCLHKCIYCGSLVNRDSRRQYSRHQNALERYAGAKGVTALLQECQ